MLRWWDGEQWTEHRTDDPAAPASAKAPEEPAYDGPTKTSGWAIAAVVLGLLGGVLFAILCGVIAKDRIRKSGGRLTGDGLATTGIVLGSVWAVAAIAILAGGGLTARDNTDRFKTGAEAQIARVVDEVERAFDDDRGDEACAELFTVEFATNVARGSGQSCGDFVDDAIGDREFQAEIKIKKVTVSGAVATVAVSEGGDAETWTLRRQRGAWRVDSIRSR